MCIPQPPPLFGGSPPSSSTCPTSPSTTTTPPAPDTNPELHTPVSHRCRTDSKDKDDFAIDQPPWDHSQLMERVFEDMLVHAQSASLYDDIICLEHFGHEEEEQQQQPPYAPITAAAAAHCSIQTTTEAAFRRVRPAVSCMRASHGSHKVMERADPWRWEMEELAILGLSPPPLIRQTGVAWPRVRRSDC